MVPTCGAELYSERQTSGPVTKRCAEPPIVDAAFRKHHIPRRHDVDVAETRVRVRRARVGDGAAGRDPHGGGPDRDGVSAALRELRAALPRLREAGGPGDHLHPRRHRRRRFGDRTNNREADQLTLDSHATGS